MAKERLIVKKEQYSFEPVFFEHFARYKFAQKYVKNKKTLDAACGTGYGSYYLTKQAKEVQGIDISEETINFCNQNYQKKSLTFDVMDVGATSFLDNYFNTIISFETIEHLENVPNFLDEMKRILKPKGHFIVSTPIKGVYDQTFIGDNPFHLNEMTIDEFKNVLNARFQIVEMYGQILKPYMKVNESKLKNHSNYKKTSTFKLKHFFRTYLFSHTLTYPLFLALSKKMKDNLLTPYQEGNNYKLITAVCIKND